MDWIERRNELQAILRDITESEMPVQIKRNLRRLLAMVAAINEQLGSHGNEEW